MVGAPGALLAALAVLAAVQVRVWAQITEAGICPFSTPLADWDEEQFVSEPWFEVRAFAVPGVHDALPTPGCTRWHFSKSDDGLGLHAKLAFRSREGEGFIRAFAQYTSSDKYPRFNLTFHDLGAVGAPRSVDMKLIATNYDDFALLWGCSEPNLFERKVVSWVLSRRPVLSDDAQETLRTLFKRHDIRAGNFVDTDHDQQTCGAAAPTVPAPSEPDGLGLGGGEADSRTDSVFAAYRPGQDSAALGQALSPYAEQLGDSSRGTTGPDAAAAADSSAESEAGSAVSWNYLGGDWSVLGTQGVLVAVLLVLAAVSLVGFLLTVRAVVLRLQGGAGANKAVPVLPLHREHVVVATLGRGVDYSRFGGLGQGLVQTRKHAADPAART